jgi:hypothetical protein
MGDILVVEVQGGDQRILCFGDPKTDSQIAVIVVFIAIVSIYLLATENHHIRRDWLSMMTPIS